jgi:FixJ family two-component response regulator
MMPEIQGHELAQTMLELRPELRVIFMTGYASAAHNLHQLSDIGPLLRKPFQTTRLIDTIQELVGEAGAAGTVAAPPQAG